MNLFKYLLFVFMILPDLLLAQTIMGKVLERDSLQHGIPGVSIYWNGTTIATNTDQYGGFEIAAPANLPAELIFSLVGYKGDTIVVTNPDVFLRLNLKSVELKAVEIESRKQSSAYSVLKPINTQTLGVKELQKAACCNLSESFETNSSVDVTYSDAISGAKKLSILGLDGVYTQILSENLPLIRGLSSSFGLSLVPGTWIESIDISKGTGSVLNGYESISGQIGVELQKPEKSDRFFLNAFGNAEGRVEGNAHFSERFNDKWSTMVFLHGSNMSVKKDHNDDGFLETPLSTQLNFFNRWKYTSSRFAAQFGIKLLEEKRQGGQRNFNYDTDHGTTHAYGIGINTKQAEFFSKTAILFPTRPYKGLALVSTLRNHQHRSYFGLRNYDADQNSLYLNFIYQSIIYDTQHKFKTGASFSYDSYDEVLEDSTFTRTEQVEGVYGEYTYDNIRNFTLVAGFRIDHHNIHGLVYTPRLHLKYNLGKNTFLRLSSGKGQRTANIIAENLSYLASSRKIVIKEELDPEVAWTSGISFTHQFQLFKKEASLNMDVFRTDFMNQVIVDLDQDVSSIYFYNLHGKSFSNSFQVDFSFEPIERLETKIAYKWLEVKSTYDSVLLSKPFVAKDRVLFNIGYTTKFDKWKFDFTLNWNGLKRIPDLAANSEAHHFKTRSESYAIMNLQVTRTFKFFSVYLGIENLTDFVQHFPIVAPDEPFGNNFDASMIWGPVMGRSIYVGFKMSIK